MKNNKISQAVDLYENLKDNEFYNNLNLDEEKSKILKLSNEINGTKFKIAVIGEFSTGKSTIINSFLQKDILPAKYRPTTNQITIIKNSKTEYVRVENQPDTSLELSKENVSKLNTTSNNNIEIGLELPNLSDYEIYDTPGVNDPSMFSDEIVFDLIGKVDITIFVLHATQTLKQTEINFLTKLIRKKDIEKFFFIINQVDIIGDEKYEVKDEFLEKISNLLNESKSQIENQTFLYSAKNSLKAILDNDNQALIDSGYNSIISGIDNFIKDNKQELFDDIAKRDLSNIIKNSLIKINTTLDIIDNKDKEYGNTLKTIQKEINDFQIEIEDAIYDFKRDFDNHIMDFRDSIKQAFRGIQIKIIEEIYNSDIEELRKDRYIEIHTKKLIEDVTDEEFKKFSKSLTINFKKLDEKIQPIFNEKNVVINNLITKNIASTIVNSIAVGGAVIGAVIYTPTILTIGAVGVGLSFVPVIGGTIGTIGILAMQASKIVFNLAKWGVKLVGNFTNSIENQIKLKQYQASIENSINQIENDIILNIDKEFDSNSYIDSFINEKFPQKEELEKRIEHSKKDFEINIQDSAVSKNSLETIKIHLEGIIK